METACGKERVQGTEGASAGCSVQVTCSLLGLRQVLALEVLLGVVPAEVGEGARRARGRAWRRVGRRWRRGTREELVVVLGFDRVVGRRRRGGGAVDPRGLEGGLEEVGEVGAEDARALPLLCEGWSGGVRRGRRVRGAKCMWHVHVACASACACRTCMHVACDYCMPGACTRLGIEDEHVALSVEAAQVLAFGERVGRTDASAEGILAAMAHA